MPIARKVRITGRVQGVSFRVWTAHQAQLLGLAGWVRNRNDGSVEVRIEGESGQMDVLIGRLGKGPPGAIVENVEVDDADCEGSSSFRIRD